MKRVFRVWTHSSRRMSDISPPFILSTHFSWRRAESIQIPGACSTRCCSLIMTLSHLAGLAPRTMSFHCPKNSFMFGDVRYIYQIYLVFSLCMSWTCPLFFRISSVQWWLLLSAAECVMAITLSFPVCPQGRLHHLMNIVLGRPVGCQKTVIYNEV